MGQAGRGATAAGRLRDREVRGVINSHLGGRNRRFDELGWLRAAQRGGLARSLRHGKELKVNNPFSRSTIMKATMMTKFWKYAALMSGVMMGGCLVIHS